MRQIEAPLDEGATLGLQRVVDAEAADPDRHRDDQRNEQQVEFCGEAELHYALTLGWRVGLSSRGAHKAAE